MDRECTRDWKGLVMGLQVGSWDCSWEVVCPKIDLLANYEEVSGPNWLWCVGGSLGQHGNPIYMGGG